MVETLTLAGHAVTLTVQETPGGILITLRSDGPAGFRWSLLNGARHWCTRITETRGNSSHAYEAKTDVVISAIGNKEHILKTLPLLRAELKSELQRQVAQEHDFDLLATG